MLYVLFVYCCCCVLQSKVRNVLRLGLHSLGSVLWGDDLCCQESPAHSHSLTTFLYALRALLRSSLSVAMVTVPSHLIQVRMTHWLSCHDMCVCAYVFSNYYMNK